MVIKHLRDLTGITTGISNDQQKYTEAHFADMRKFTTIFDEKYPGVLGTSYGPCVGMNPFNAHCGSTFVPDCGDQQPYLKPGQACISSTVGAEAVLQAETDWPWSIKLSRVMYGTILGEAYSGHAGPFFSRETLGISWKCNQTTTAIRLRWGGNNVNPCP